MEELAGTMAGKDGAVMDVLDGAIDEKPHRACGATGSKDQVAGAVVPDFEDCGKMSQDLEVERLSQGTARQLLSDRVRAKCRSDALAVRCHRPSISARSAA